MPQEDDLTLCKVTEELLRCLGILDRPNEHKTAAYLDMAIYRLAATTVASSVH
jgi:hypothetical protein